MTIVLNLFCKAFIAILDILLLDFYLKNIYQDVYKDKSMKSINILYIMIFASLIISTNIKMVILVYILASVFIIFKLHRWNIYLIDIIHKLCIFFITKIIIFIISIYFLSWIFDSRINLNYTDFSSMYLVFNYCVNNFITYIICIYIFKIGTLNIKRFKILCLLIITCFTLVFILNNDILFRNIAIARTYIFTVVISIIALICFDRMQTKYEKDKHLQESIIQNLEKEKEFNQQREQQQKEIRKINHNLNNILIILQSHLEKEEYEEAKNYIEQNLKTHVEAYQALTHTGIAAIDGALNAHIQSIKEKGIQYDEDISKILHLGSIVPGDLALIISLALDNAKEACENIEGEKHISLKLQSKQTHVILYIENSIPEGSHPTFHKTSKKDKIAHGFGVSSIKEMAERYHGEAKYEVEHDQVILRVVLQK